MRPVYGRGRAEIREYRIAPWDSASVDINLGGAANGQVRHVGAFTGQHRCLQWPKTCSQAGSEVRYGSTSATCPN